MAFFRDLQTELKKISLFYAAEERRCSFRFRQLRSVLKTLKVCRGKVVQYLLSIVCSYFTDCIDGVQTKGKVDTREAQRLMFAFVHFYRECTRLENFAVINYQGFSKV